jgi:hypothetical protein
MSEDHDLEQRFLNAVQNDRSAWTTLIGTFIVSFGEIEMLVDWLLARFTGGPLAPSVAKKPFVARARSATDAIQNRLPDDARRKALIAAMTDAIELSKARNTIAHNAMRIGRFKDDQGVGRMRLEIRPFREDALVLQLTDLEALVDRARDIGNRIDDFVGDET